MAQTTETTNYQNSRTLPIMASAGRLETYVHKLLRDRNQQDGFTVDVLCQSAARKADSEINALHAEINALKAANLQLEKALNFANAANRQHVRDLNDARQENARILAGGLAIAL